jgi:hypothetical protein
MNHVAHSEATKVAKITEANLKARVDDLDIANQKLDAELKKSVFFFSFCLFCLVLNSLSYRQVRHIAISSILDTNHPL